MALSPEQLQAMMNMAPSPNASAAVLGHSTGIMDATHGSAGQPLPMGYSTPQNLSQMGPIGDIGNAVLGGASDLGVHLADVAGNATGKIATAVTGNTTEADKIAARQQTQTNIFGKPVAPLKGIMGGIKQFGGDLLKTGGEFLGLAAAPATIPAAIGTGAIVGASQGAGTALQNDASASDIAKQGAIGGVVGGVTGGTVAGFGKLIGEAGNKIMTSVIKPSRADIEDGFSIDTLKQYGLGGSLNQTLQKTQSAMSDLSSQLNEKLAGSSAKIDMNDVLNQTVKELTDSSKLKGFGANTSIQNTLAKLKDEVGIVNQDGGLSIPDAQIVKQASGNFGAWQYGRQDPDSKASEIVYNTFYNKLKTSIEQNSPEGVKDINQQLSKLIPVANAVIRRLPVAERSNAISLNEMIGLVGSTFHPAALGPTILNMVSKSGGAGNALAGAGPQIAAHSAMPALLTGQLGEQGSDQGQSTSL